MNSSNKGSVLIISLIIMSIATSLALFIIKITKDITVSSSLILEKLEAKIKAESEIERLKYLFLTGSFGFYSFKPGTFTKLYPQEIFLNGKEFAVDNDIKISVVDTSSKINLYIYTEEKRLKDVFKTILDKNKALILADTYLDWIDRDSFTRIAGAERDYYVKHTRYTPRNNIFMQDLEELLNIKGYSQETYKHLKKYLTLSYTGGDINLFLVDNKLLNALSFVNKATLDAIKNLKNTDRFKDLKKLIEKNSGLTEIFSLEPSKILEITVKAKSGNAVEKIYCIIDFKETEEKPCTVYKYKE